MTRNTYDAGSTAFPDGERLHEAFAEELDRPGLEGPAFDAVLRSGTVRLRRRRATVGATFAVASVAAVATAALAAGGTTRGVDSAASAAAGTGPAANPAVTTVSTVGTVGTTSGAQGAVTTPAPANAPSSRPADAVLASGSVNGHAWQLVRKFALDQPMLNMPPSGSAPQWCGSLDVIVDGVQTNAGDGNSPCLTRNGTPQAPANPADPGFTSVVILDAHHDRLGTLVTGSISPLITSVTAQCASKSLTAQPIQPPGDTSAYYSFTLPNGSGCQLGSLAFFNAAGTRTASLSDVAFEGGK